MPGFSWTAGLLATGAFVTAAAAAQLQQGTPTPYAACMLIKEEIEQNKPGKEDNIKRYETCMNQADAVFLLKQGRSAEALEALSRASNKPKLTPQQ